MTSNSHSTMDDLESEDNTTANPNEQNLANCEGENANLNRQGGAAKKKKQLIMKAVIYMYIIVFVLIGCIHWTLVGVVWFLYLSLVLSMLLVSNTSIVQLIIILSRPGGNYKICTSNAIMKSVLRNTFKLKAEIGAKREKNM